MNIVDLAITNAKKEHAKCINHIEVEIGTMSGVMIDALRFGFEAAAKNTFAEGAELVINEVAAKARCRKCDAIQPVTAYFEECPICNEFLTDIIQGKDMRVLSVTIDE